MIRKILQKKYDNQFNFYFVKAINQIVQNETYAITTIDYKDFIVWSENNEYLKRVYYLKNSFGRNEIYDRISMLAEFYDSTVLVKYQLPVMILTKTKDIFLKRIKRMKKMIASDCSSQESSSQQNQESSYGSFESSGFLRTIHTEELSKSSNSLNRQEMEMEKEYESEAYDIFEQNMFDPSETLYRPQLKPLNIQFPSKDGAVEHLVVDIDDVDKQRVVKEYDKVQERENKLIHDMEDKGEKNMKKDKMKSSKIVITPLDNYLPSQVEEFDRMKEDSFKGRYHPNPKSSKISRKQHRTRPYDEEIYDETIRVNTYTKIRSPNPHIPGSLHLNSNFYSPRATTVYPQEMMETQRQKHRLSHHFPAPYQRQTKRLQREQQPYYTGENSQDTSGRLSKKQQIRQRATALLQKVRSEENLMRMSYQPRALSRHYPY